jgi:DNA helicase-2/ATP-dependent DNA helicase PcrA
MVDEFQDTNITQYELIKLLGGKYRNVCVVGDPDQSIYSWRFADLRNILSFEKDYPDAKVILLEQNYRSTKTILDTASNVIEKNKQRKPRKLFTENEEGEPVSVIEAYSETSPSCTARTRKAACWKRPLSGTGCHIDWPPGQNFTSGGKSGTS